MNNEIYQQRLKELEKEFSAKKNALVKECALANNPYKVGDVISDHMGSIRIEKIITTTSNYKPTCVYEGIELKKDLTPAKKQTGRSVWQINVKK